jgi:nicotinamide-nucleotide amidase
MINNHPTHAKNRPSPNGTTSTPCKVAILTVGDELLIGQVINTNAGWIGERARSHGYQVALQLTVGDTMDQIIWAISLALSKAQYVLVSGGLGPTDDDLTVAAVAQALGRPLVEDPQWIARMEAFFASRGRTMTPNNRRQALRPQGAEIIDNKIGSACGHWIELNEKDLTGAEHAGKHIALMPGVPYEMKQMMADFVEPRLKAANPHQYIYTKTILTAGMGESVLAHRLGDMSDMMKNNISLAYLPSLGEVRLRITTQGPTMDHAQATAKPLQAHIEKTLTHIIYGYDTDTLEAALGRALTQRQATIAVAESCTGGLVNHRLTNVPGSSRYISGGVIAYANDVKTQELGVSSETLTQHGAVSEQTAIAMAEGVRRKFNATLGLAITGIAGPDGGTPEKPVGTVWFAIADANGTKAIKQQFETDRLRNKERSAAFALNFARLRLQGVESVLS